MRWEDRKLEPKSGDYLVVNGIKQHIQFSNDSEEATLGRRHTTKGIIFGIIRLNVCPIYRGSRRYNPVVSLEQVDPQATAEALLPHMP